MSKINIVIPMAGDGSRFSKVGFNNPKPLIPLNGKTFIEWSIDSVDFQQINTNFIFIIREKHREKLERHLKKIKPDCVILFLEHLTRGAVESCLIAKDYINNDTPLIITNSDQIFEWDKEKYIKFVFDNNIQANVITVKENTDKFSYIKLNEFGYGTELAEKIIISNNALVGIHYWNKGSLFVSSGEKLIERNIRANNEFYISLTYNILIDEGIKVTNYELNDNEKYLSVGTPEQVYDYLNIKNMNVKIDKLDRFKRGWIIGNFEPSLLKNTGIELAVMKGKKGEGPGDYHYHEKCTEINILITGKIKINDKIINENDIFIFEPFVPSIYEYLEDSVWVTFKNNESNYDKITM
jgi:choline kinase